MTTSLPIDHHQPQIPVRARVDVSEDGLTIEVPTETGDMVMIGIERSGVQDSYTFEFSGELCDIAPEALTACVQMAFLTLRQFRMDLFARRSRR